jgi:cytochrome P450
MEKLDPRLFVDIDLQSGAIKKNFRAILAEWALRPPFYVMQSGSPQVVVSRFADLKEVLQSHSRFASVQPQERDPALQKFAPNKFMTVTPPTQMEGALHNRIRRLINPVFSEASVRKFEPIIERHIDALIEEVAGAGPEFEIMGGFCAQLMPRVLLDALFGFSPDERRIFVEMNHCLRLTARLKPGEPFPVQYVETFNRAEAMIKSVIADRRNNPTRDVVSELIASVDEGDVLTNTELFELIFVFGAGSIESTASSLGAALLTLGQHPDQFDEIKADHTLIPGAIEECLRYHGPGFLLFTRYALVDTDVGGTFFPAGIPVYVCHQAAAYDPLQFPEPLKFDIHRNPSNVPVFGGGRHFCVGNRLARTVLRIALTKLIARFPNLRLADPDFEPTYVGALSETQLQRLPMMM